MPSYTGGAFGVAMVAIMEADCAAKHGEHAAGVNEVGAKINESIVRYGGRDREEIFGAHADAGSGLHQRCRTRKGHPVHTRKGACRCPCCLQPRMNSYIAFAAHGCGTAHREISAWRKLAARARGA